jgi:hypothetical protein
MSWSAASLMRALRGLQDSAWGLALGSAQGSPGFISGTGDGERYWNRKADKERRVVRVITAVVIVAVVVAAVPIPPAVTLVCVVFVTAVVPSTIVPVIISSRMDGGVTAVNGSRVGRNHSEDRDDG